MSQNTEYTVDPSRLVSPDAAPADAAEEVSLRPKTLDDYANGIFSPFQENTAP